MADKSMTYKGVRLSATDDDGLKLLCAYWDRYVKDNAITGVVTTLTSTKDTIEVEVFECSTIAERALALCQFKQLGAPCVTHEGTKHVHWLKRHGLQDMGGFVGSA